MTDDMLAQAAKMRADGLSYGRIGEMLGISKDEVRQAVESPAATVSTPSSTMLAPDVIRTDGGTQAREGTHNDTVLSYVDALREGAEFPALVVYYDGEHYWLADGFHRLAAWRAVGAAEVPATVRQGDRRDAVLCSVGANAAHGLQRTNADKRRAVQRMLEDPEWRNWSSRQIADACRVSHTMVNNIRAEAHDRAEAETPERDAPEPARGAAVEVPRGPEGTSTTAPEAPQGEADDARESPERLDDGADVRPASTMAESEPEGDVFDGAPEGEMMGDDIRAAIRSEYAGFTHSMLIEELVDLRLSMADLEEERSNLKGELDEAKRILSGSPDADRVAQAMAEAALYRNRMESTLRDLNKSLWRVRAYREALDALGVNPLTVLSEAAQEARGKRDA